MRGRGTTGSIRLLHWRRRAGRSCLRCARHLQWLRRVTLCALGTTSRCVTGRPLHTDHANGSSLGREGLRCIHISRSWPLDSKRRRMHTDDFPCDRCGGRLWGGARHHEARRLRACNRSSARCAGVTQRRGRDKQWLDAPRRDELFARDDCHARWRSTVRVIDVRHIDVGHVDVGDVRNIDVAHVSWRRPIPRHERLMPPERHPRDSRK